MQQKQHIGYKAICNQHAGAARLQVAEEAELLSLEVKPGGGEAEFLHAFGTLYPWNKVDLGELLLPAEHLQDRLPFSELAEEALHDRRGLVALEVLQSSPPPELSLLSVRALGVHGRRAGLPAMVVFKVGLTGGGIAVTLTFNANGFGGELL